MHLHQSLHMHFRGGPRQSAAVREEGEDAVALVHAAVLADNVRMARLVALRVDMRCAGAALEAAQARNAAGAAAARAILEHPGARIHEAAAVRAVGTAVDTLAIAPVDALTAIALLASVRCG